MGQIVLITGASSGIGYSLAKEFAHRGAKLVLTARRKDRLSSLEAELKAKGADAISIACDVTRDGDLENAFERARQTFGKVDIVVANAGFSVAGDVEELSIEDYRRQFETNVFGVLRTVRASLHELKRNHGSLVLIGSVMDSVSLPGSSPYAMSKFAIRALAESLSNELKPAGVSVTLISPGFISTEIRMVDNQGKLVAGSKDPIPQWLCMPADKAARQIIRAVARGKREQTITFHGKLAVFLSRHFHGLVSSVIGLGVKRKKAAVG